MASLIPSSWNTPERFRERLGARAGRQRAMVEEGHLLLVLHKVPEPDRDDRDAVFFWRAPDGQWKASGGGGLGALKEHVATYEKTVDALEERLHRARSASDYFDILREAAPIARAARNLHKTLQEARDALSKERELILLRDQAYDVDREAELLHADARNGLDFTIAKRGEEQARLSEDIAEKGHRLNLLAAMFFPITALGSLLGMNLASGLEQYRAPWLFWGVAGMAFLLGFMLRSSLSSPPPKKG